MIMLFEHGLFATELRAYYYEKKHVIDMEVAAARAAEHRASSMYSEEGEPPGVRLLASANGTAGIFDNLEVLVAAN